MATDNIPPPPFLGPTRTVLIPNVTAGNLAFIVFAYKVERGGWYFYGTSFGGWDSLPLGYYRTQANFADVPMMVVVTSRMSPDGELLPGLLSPQDSPIVQGEDCPDGYGDVPVAELNIQNGAYGALDYWLSSILGISLAQLCAQLAVQQVPTCPEGFTWDPATETCKANPIIPIPPPPVCPPGYHYDVAREACVPDNPDIPPPPPTCPPGYTWDPITATCQPTTPPATPTPCPPFTQLPDCLPTPPASDPDLDEVGDLTEQLAYWLEIQSIYLMNLFEVIKKMQPSGGTGTGGNSDPVTCTQLTAQVKLITDALTTIASVIAATSRGGSTPIDLTPITDKLQAIADAIAKESGATADPNVKRIADTLNGFPPDEPGAADQLNALIDLGVTKYGFPSELAQLWKS